MKICADNAPKPTRATKFKRSVRGHDQLRGTVQADILKKTRPSNLHLFQPKSALRVGDIASTFVHHGVRTFYSVIIFGYHIAEACANRSRARVHALEGFTFVEAYLAKRPPGGWGGGCR